ncbi:MAG: PD-(D/E)XK nuclease family protein [Candidatus Micrarchaeaceae archaeon]
MTSGRQADFMGVLDRLNKSSIRVTDIASQYWCEKQMELRCLNGRKITKELQKGSVMHEDMAEETNLQLDLKPRSYADFMYKTLYESYMALESLSKQERTREVSIFGKISGFRVVGKIDQLSVKGGSLRIYEDKTTSSKEPSQAALLVAKVQVMVYREMIDQIKSGSYTLNDFRKATGTPRLKLTPEFERQIEAMHISESLRSIPILESRYFEKFVSLPEFDERLYIRYIDQFTGKTIKLFSFRYSEKEANEKLSFAMKYWKGERSALPVSYGERSKCNMCEFFGKECKVWWQNTV